MSPSSGGAHSLVWPLCAQMWPKTTLYLFIYSFIPFFYVESHFALWAA